MLVASLGDVFFYGEELAKAAAGKALLDGLEVEHHQLAYHYYEGGGFVFSHLDALFFAAFGPSLLTLKGVALSWTALTLVAGVALAARCFGRAAGGWFGALFVLAPQSFQKLSLLALGIHFEAGLFLVLALLLLVRIVIEGRRAPWSFGLLGLACGFGLYFSYQCLLVLAYALAVLAILRGRDLLGVRGLAALLGLCLGAAPLAAMAATVGAEVLDIHGASLGAAASDRVTRLGAFAASLLERRSWVELTGMAAWSLTPLAGSVWLVAGARDARARAGALLLGGFLALFLAVYAASDFAVGEVYHYFRLNRLSPAWMLSALLAAGVLSRGWLATSTAVRWGTRGLGAILVACGGADLAQSLGPSTSAGWSGNLARLASMPGYSYGSYLPRLLEHSGGGPLETARLALGFVEPQRSWLRAEIGQALLCVQAQSVEQAAERARQLDPLDWEGYLLGAGPLWAQLHRLGTAGRVAALSSLPDELEGVLAEASGRFGGGLRVSPEGLRRELGEALSAGAPARWIEGLGWRLSRVEADARAADQVHPGFLLDPGSADAFLEALPTPDVRAAMRRGWERALAERTLP